MISRACEEFGCLPSQAYAELMDDPDNLAVTIMELRSYARADAEISQWLEHQHGDPPAGPMVELVHEMRYEILKEDRSK